MMAEIFCLLGLIALLGVFSGKLWNVLQFQKGGLYPQQHYVVFMTLGLVVAIMAWVFYFGGVMSLIGYEQTLNVGGDLIVVKNNAFETFNNFFLLVNALMMACFGLTFIEFIMHAGMVVLPKNYRWF